jgi:hypothetical protein
VARGRSLRCGVSAGGQCRFVWLGVFGAASRAVVLCQLSLSSPRVNGHHPWIRITRVICGQDPGMRPQKASTVQRCTVAPMRLIQCCMYCVAGRSD